jgi:hypothetical protein
MPTPEILSRLKILLAPPMEENLVRWLENFRCGGLRDWGCGPILFN